MMKRIAGFVMAAASVFAQVQAPAAFDAVSVRTTASDDRVVTIDVGPGGRFAAHGYSLRLLVQRAFGMKGYQVAGDPSWLDVDRYDVVARAPVGGDLTEEQLRPMLQAMLADRFHLRYHHVAKQMPGFGLGVAGSRSKLKASAATQEQSERTLRRRGAALVGDGMTTATLAVIFGAYLAKPVADETGLKGLYDFEITWTERADQVVEERVGAEAGGVSLITALRDQLGLTLTPKRVDVDTIAIDGAEKASAN